MQERVHKLSVRKTVRQTQATHLHPWFKLLFQQGTEPNCTSCIWSLHLLRSSAPGELSSHRSSCACHSGLPSLGWGRPGNPLPVPCSMNWTFHCPYQGQQSRSCAGSSDLIAEQWVGAAFPAFSLISWLLALLLQWDGASTASGHGS